MGFSPKQWGSEGWHFIHYVALNYPAKPTEDDKKKYMMFLESLQYTLPCEGCSYNWSEKLKKNPPMLNSRKEFFEWTVDMHNQINKSNGKKILTYEQAVKKIARKKDKEILKDGLLLSSIAIVLLLTISKKISKI